jgi:hypothetical protein
MRGASAREPGGSIYEQRLIALCLGRGGRDVVYACQSFALGVRGQIRREGRTALRTRSEHDAVDRWGGSLDGEGGGSGPGSDFTMTRMGVCL